MSSGREAKLIMRLIDGVSGPGKAIAGSLATVTAATRTLRSAAFAAPSAVAAIGTSARRSAQNTAPLSAGILMAASASARAVYQYEKMGNAAEAVGLLTENQRSSLEDYAMALNTEFPALNKDILGAAFELNRAGMNFDQMMGSLRSTLNVSLAGDIEIPETADIMTNIAQAMRLPMATREQVAASMKEVEDVLAYSATKSNTDIREMAVVFRYVAPLAAATGQNLKELAAYSMELANNGIKASNAGTGLRFALMSLISPSEKALKAFKALDINPAEYVQGAQRVSAEALADQLSLDGINAKALIPQMQKLLDDPTLSKAPLKLVANMSDMISAELGEDSFIDRNVLARSLTESLTVLGTQIDLRGFLKAFKNNPASEAYFSDIFGKRHAAKMMAILAGDVEKKLELMEANYRGSAERMSRIRVKGIVGFWMRLQAAWENLNITLGKNGMLDTASKAITGFTEGITSLSKADPELLNFAATSVLAVGALAPIGFVLSGLAATAAFALNPITWVGAGLATIAAMNWDKIKGPALQFFKGFAKFVHLKWKQFSIAADGFWAGLTTGLSDDTLNLLDDIGDAFSSLFTTLTGNTNTFAWRRWGSALGQGLAEWVNTATNGVRAVQSKFKELKVWFENWDWKLPSPADAIAAVTQIVWSDVIPKLKDWSGIIFSPIWKDYIKPVPWGDLIGQIGWGDILNILQWGTLIFTFNKWRKYIKAIKWKDVAGKLKWGGTGGLIKRLAWKALKVIPYIGWVSLAGELVWDNIIKELGWDKYLNLDHAKKLLRDFKEWLWAEFPWLANVDAMKAAQATQGAQALQRALMGGVTRDEVTNYSVATSKPSEVFSRQYNVDDAFAVAELRAEQLRRSRQGGAAKTNAEASLHSTNKTLTNATANWPEAAKTALDEYVQVLSRGGRRSEEKAAEIAERIKTLLGVVVTPKVDTSSIDAANSNVLGLRNNLNSLNAIWNGHNSSVFTPGISYGAPTRKIDGARRKGGPVHRGGLFLVGEDGPELLRMEGDGDVIPNDQIGNALSNGGQGAPVYITNHWHLQGTDPEQHAKKMMQVMSQQMSRSRQISMSGRTQFG